MQTPKHVVALSGGKDSVAMALLLKATQPKTEFEYICNVTGNELPLMLAHWKNLEQILGCEIKNVTSDDTLVSLCQKNGNAT